MVAITSAGDSNVRYWNGPAAHPEMLACTGHHRSLLAERGWQEIELSEIINPSRVQRVSIESPEILVPAIIVQPLALVVHKLLINAAVHGSLRDHSGTLRIHWQKMPGQGGFKLRWQESGRPAPSHDPQPGFGTAMVGAMIEKQLLGKVEREWSDDGSLLITVYPP